MDSERPPSDDFFAAFVTECSDPVVTLDGEGTVVYANPATEATFSMQRSPTTTLTAT